MNLSPTCPNIPDGWRGNLADTCRILGGDKPISRTTLDKYAKAGKRFGGIDFYIGKRGVRMFSGKEVKRFWNQMQ